MTLRQGFDHFERGGIDFAAHFAYGGQQTGARRAEVLADVSRCLGARSALAHLEDPLAWVIYDTPEAIELSGDFAHRRRVSGAHLYNSPECPDQMCSTSCEHLTRTLTRGECTEGILQKSDKILVRRRPGAISAMYVL